ncbi:MAG: DsrE family protein [Actinomycetota bacterium]
MGKMLIHVTAGVESPTKATLAALVARNAVAEGHEVDVFFGGDAVSLLRPATAEALQGVGLGSFKEHLDAAVAGGAKLFASKLSGVARGVGEGDLGGLPVTFAAPNELVRHALEADGTLSY